MSSSSSYSYTTLSGIGTKCFSSCCDKDSATIFRSAAYLTLTLLKLEWVLSTANAAGTNGLTFLPKHGGVRDDKFCVGDQNSFIL
jgi:hypothetical protein